MYNKVINYIILICSLIILCFIFFNIFENDKNIYKFYTYTIKGEAFLVGYYFLYFVGSFLNLRKNNQGNNILLFAFSGFVLSAIGDYIFVGTYDFFIYILYILLNCIAFSAAKQNMTWKKLLIFLVFNIIFIYCLFLTLQIRLIL